jgi:hypothetical protein
MESPLHRHADPRFMPALFAGIHVLRRRFGRQGADDRDKPGHGKQHLFSTIGPRLSKSTSDDLSTIAHGGPTI